MPICDGCKQELPEKMFLTCSFCGNHYDLDCAGVSEKRFYNTMTTDHKNKWKCPACVCMTRKQINSNTPAKPSVPGTSYDEADKINVTLRQKPSRQITNNNSLIDLDVDEITGHTQESQLQQNNSMSFSTPTTSQGNSTTDMITLEKFSKLLDSKLDSKFESIKASILADIKDIIKSEINNAVTKLKQDTEQTHIVIKNEQKDLSGQIKKIDEKIRNIKNKLEDLESSKKIVLYGLNETYNENNYTLYDRVSQVFGDIMDININPYIEEIRRIGKRGNRRPLEIEFMSKRVTRHIIENSKCFRNTGLAVEAFITGEKLQERNTLKQKLQEARHNGSHAVIRNNRLYINGKEFINQDYTTEEPQTIWKNNNIENGENKIQQTTHTSFRN